MENLSLILRILAILCFIRAIRTGVKILKYLWDKKTE